MAVHRTPTDLVNAILKDSNISPRNLPGGSYSGMVEAYRVGIEVGELPDISIAGTPDNPSILIDGFPADHPMFRNVAGGETNEPADSGYDPDCGALCTAGRAMRAAITGGWIGGPLGPAGPGVNAAGRAGADALGTHITRMVVIVVGIALLLIGVLALVLKSPVGSTVVKALPAGRVASAAKAIAR